MSDIAVKVEGLGKRFSLNLVPHLSLKEMPDKWLRQASAMANRLGHGLLGARWPVQSPKGAASSKEFWALRDISFELSYGQVMGILGNNGTGKSTLLKILSQTMKPTEGRAELHGRVGSMLELGTGFKLDLSGRENIYLYGSVLGMNRASIAARFDEIVDFSGVEQFLEEPVKNYSSGMYARLAFSVAAHLECDILLVDEVLSAGDVAFAARCFDKMQEITRQGRAALFVSHNLNAVDQMCDLGMVLQGGRINYLGLAGDAIEHYTGGIRARLAEEQRNPATFPPNESLPVQFKSIRMCNEAGEPANVFQRKDKIVIVCELVVRRPSADYFTSLTLLDEKYNLLIYSTDMDGAAVPLRDMPPGEHCVKIVLPGNLLKMGHYSLTPGLEGKQAGWIAKHDNLFHFMIEDIACPTNQLAHYRNNLIAPDVAWQSGA